MTGERASAFVAQRFKRGSLCVPPGPPQAQAALSTLLDWFRGGRTTYERVSGSLLVRPRVHSTRAGHPLQTWHTPGTSALTALINPLDRPTIPPGVGPTCAPRGFCAADGCVPQPRARHQPRGVHHHPGAGQGLHAPVRLRGADACTALYVTVRHWPISLNAHLAHHTFDRTTPTPNPSHTTQRPTPCRVPGRGHAAVVSGLPATWLLGRCGVGQPQHGGPALHCSLRLPGGERTGAAWGGATRVMYHDVSSDMWVRGSKAGRCCRAAAVGKRVIGGLGRPLRVSCGPTQMAGGTGPSQHGNQCVGIMFHNGSGCRRKAPA